MSRNNGGTPGVLPGSSVLPPMEPPTPRLASTVKANEKPEGTAATGNRFRELNAFVDCSMVNLSKAALGTWFVLYRDTKPNGTVRTSMSDIARRVGVHRRTIVTAVANLERQGLLTVV